MVTWPETLLEPAHSVRIVKRLNVRSLPTTMSTRVGRLEPEQRVPVEAVAEGEPFLERTSWYRIAGAVQYFWSGGAELEESADALGAGPPSVGPAPDIRRRANGTIRPLEVAELRQIFGDFQFEPVGRAGAVKIITGGWEAGNLVPFDHPALRAIKRHPPMVHGLALPHLQRVFDEITALGLAEDILTFDGSFVPRYKNWNFLSGQLSAHSWGIAIDLNSRFNAVNRQPALPGETGCVRRLVPLFNEAGFAWGGHFSSNVDGMHFELARRNP